MSVTAVQFWQQLDSSGLISAEASRLLASEMAADLSPDQMLDGTAAAAWLVKRKKLSEYQAKVALGLNTGPLRCGSYVVVSEVNDASLPNWYRVTHESTEGEYWLLAVPETLLNSDQFRSNPPSIRLAREHARVQDASLSALSEPQISHGFLCVASNRLVGRSIASTMQGVAMPVTTARAIVIQIAMALDQLHEAKLVHGDLGLHCVWWDGDQTICLARDPLFLPTNPLAESARLAVIQADPKTRLRYAAPEFTVPGQLPTIATDLYALGCLWFELLTGKPLVEGEDTASIAKSILKSSRKPLSVEGFDKNSQRLLDHLLAKNPSNRFSSARQFLQAMQAAKAPSISASAVASVPAEVQKPSPNPTTNPVGPDDAKSPNPVAPEKRSAWQSDPPAQKPPSSPKAGTTTERPSKADSIPAPVVTKAVEAKAPQTVAATARQNKVAPPEQAKTVAPSPKPPRTSEPQTPPPEAALQAVTPPKKSSIDPQVATAGTERASVAKVQTDAPKRREEEVAKASPPTSIADKSPKVANANPEPAPVRPATIQSPKLTTSDTNQASVKKPTKKTGNKRKKKPAWFLPVAGGVSILLVALLAFTLMSSKQTTVAVKPKPNADVTKAANNVSDPKQPTIEQSKGAETRPDPVSAEFNLIADDELTLWAPPFVPDPIKLHLLPPGVQGLLHLNVNKITKQSEYQQVNDLLSPAYAMFASYLEKHLPLALDRCNGVTIGIYPSDTSEWPNLVVRAELIDLQSIDELASKFQFTTPTEDLLFGKAKLKRNSNANVSFLASVDTSDESKTRTILVGVPKLVQSLVEVEGSLPTLTRQMELLRGNTTSENDVTLIATTSLLLSSGRGILENSLAGLLPYLRLKMQEDVSAVGISGNLDELWYGELRIVGKDTQSTPRLQNELKEILASLADEAEASLSVLSSNPYWSKVAFRLPQQLRALSANTRTGIESDHAVANFYLPKKAAANILFSAWMALRQPIQASANTTLANNASEPKPLTMDEILKVPVTIGFDQESLEAGSREIASAFNASLNNPKSAIQIEIDGAALEKDGITRNQQIRDFRHENKPFREVLISLVRKANPVTTVQQPNEKDQKLVWIIKDADARTIQVTTRTAAEASGATLPEEFVLPSTK